MKKIIVNPDACIGCGACVSIDPEHFEFNDEGLSYATNNENLESSDLASATSSCPTGAISIEEVNSENEDNKEEECNCENEDNKEECNCESCECSDCHCKEEE